MNDVQKENLRRLIAHYESLDGLKNWSYANCAAGVLKDLGITSDRYSDSQVANALGIDHGAAFYLVGGPPIGAWYEQDPVKMRDDVVAYLKEMLAGGMPVWPGPKN